MKQLTDDFYNNIGYSRINQLTWGETQSIHEEFFIRDESKQVSREFKTKKSICSQRRKCFNRNTKKLFKENIITYKWF